MVEKQSDGREQEEKKLLTMLREAEEAIENGEGWLSFGELQAELEDK